MKVRRKKKEVRSVERSCPAPVAPIEPEVLPPLGDIEEPDCNTPGERINYHVGMAQHHGRQALAHLILAGWELAKQKQAIGYGGWNEWCDKNLQIARFTADRYIQFFHKTVGEARKAAEIPVAKKPTLKELAAATVGMEQKSATRAMIDLDIIKRPKGWGGEREGAGRKAKDDAEAEKHELDEIANSPALLIAAIREPIATVYKAWRERDVFARIEMSDLALVAASLNELASAATAALKARSK